MFEGFFKPETPKEDPEKRKLFVSPESKKLTSRSYETYLKHFNLPETEIARKTIIDVGSGFSDFSKRANEKFKDQGTVVVPIDPVYSFFGGNFEAFQNALPAVNISPQLESAELRHPQKRYKELKEAGLMVAGSHQDLPIKDKSVDLVLGHNSMLEYKDREITKRALTEALRIIKEHGEIRLLPVAMQWDREQKSWYLHIFEPPSEGGIAEMKKLGGLIPPDLKTFEVYKALEERGVTFYLAVGFKRGMSRRRIIPVCTFIIRTDQEVPRITGTRHLERLSFRASTDNHHVPSERIPLDEPHRDTEPTPSN